MLERMPALFSLLILPVNNRLLIVNWTGSARARNGEGNRRERKGALPSLEPNMISAAHPKPAPMSRAMFEPLMDLQEAALVLGMHCKTLETKARQRQIPAFKVGKRWRFRLSSLNSWLENGINSNTTDQAVVTGQEHHP